MDEKLLAVIRLRGMQGARWRVKQVLEKLLLKRKHACVVIKETPSSLGMLRLAKDYITWGPADAKTIELLSKKGKGPYALHPPKGGLGALKLPFPKGALGNRAGAINELVGRMAA